MRPKDKGRRLGPGCLPSHIPGHIPPHLFTTGRAVEIPLVTAQKLLRLSWETRPLVFVFPLSIFFGVCVCVCVCVCVWGWGDAAVIVVPCFGAFKSEECDL